jgi:RNA-directed DNA polymerase
VNTDELESALMRAEIRVLNIQTKLHRWASDDPHRRFDDLFARHEAPLLTELG